MTAISPWAILLFGMVLGVCLPVVLRALHASVRRKMIRPTLLRLDVPPSTAGPDATSRAPAGTPPH